MDLTRRHGVVSHFSRLLRGLILASLVGLGLGCGSRTYQVTRKAAVSSYRGAKTVVRTTGKVAGAGVDVVRAAARQIPKWHEIRSGDTFHKVGSMYGVPTEELRRLNPLIDPLRLKIGQRLRLRK